MELTEFDNCLPSSFEILQVLGQTMTVPSPPTKPMSFWAWNVVSLNGFPELTIAKIALRKKHLPSNIGKGSFWTSPKTLESLEIWEDSIIQFLLPFFCHGSWFSFVSWKVSNRAERCVHKQHGVWKSLKTVLKTFITKKSNFTGGLLYCHIPLRDFDRFVGSWCDFTRSHNWIGKTVYSRFH